jgi:hypothetical protein
MHKEKDIVKIRSIILATIILFSLFCSNATFAATLQPSPTRTIFLTLIPDYLNNTIKFDGQIHSLPLPSNKPDLTGLPLKVEEEWTDGNNWNILGTVQSGELRHESRDGLYHMKLGSIELQPQEEIYFTLAYVNVVYANIFDKPDPPTDHVNGLRQLTHSFSFSAGAQAKSINIDIPFSPVRMDADLSLTPLVGETLTGRLNGFRLAGKVHFDSFTSFEEFSRYCQDTAHRLKFEDYRMAHLLTALDTPHYTNSNGRNLAFNRKPASTALRSELLRCQYDSKKSADSFVEAVFSGKVAGSLKSQNLLPIQIQGIVPQNGIYSIDPTGKYRYKGLKGYAVHLGTISLAPGDTLKITIPHTRLQMDIFSPDPDHLIYSDADQENNMITLRYVGPATFELMLPYLPQMNLYASQFPALLRPVLAPVDGLLQEFSLPVGLGSTWLVLILGLVLYLLSVFIPKLKWLSIAGWLMIGFSFYYGVRGSFGLLSVAVLYYTAQPAAAESSPSKRWREARKLSQGLAGFALVACAARQDFGGMLRFEGLAGSELSPFTPLILILLVIGLFLLFYGWSPSTKRFMRSDLPVLILLLVVPALYDAFDKRFLAMLILCIAGGTVINRAFMNVRSSPHQKENKFGNDLHRRWKLAFGNRIIPLAILLLMFFAAFHDLTSTYANEMRILLPALFAPLIIPLLVIVSIFLTFACIAILFVLVYPFIPFNTGYLKAAVFALVLFLVFLFGIGTDDRLIASLPNILVGRVIYYLSVPMLIGAFLDINEFMQKENKLRSAEGKEQTKLNLRSASSLYFKDLHGLVSTLAGILSLVLPTVYASLASQPVISTYFTLLEKLFLLPI